MRLDELAPWIESWPTWAKITYGFAWGALITRVFMASRYGR